PVFRKSARKPMPMLKLPWTLLASASAPMAMFCWPVVLAPSAAPPTATLKLPVVTAASALSPTAVLLNAVLAGFSALFPSAVELPVQSLGHCALSGGDSAKQANTSGMRRRASREGDRPIDFLKCRVVIFFDSYFFEGGLLNCINCNPAPCGTRNHLYEALLNSRLSSADSGESSWSWGLR